MQRASSCSLTLALRMYLPRQTPTSTKNEIPLTYHRVSPFSPCTHSNPGHHCMRPPARPGTLAASVNQYQTINFSFLPPTSPRNPPPITINPPHRSHRTPPVSVTYHLTPRPAPPTKQPNKRDRQLHRLRPGVNCGRAAQQARSRGLVGPVSQTPDRLGRLGRSGRCLR